MTRQTNGKTSRSASPALQTPAVQVQSSRQPASIRSASPTATPAADDAMAHHHSHSASAGAAPYSQGLFGRERALKRKPTPVPPGFSDQSLDDLDTADRRKSRKVHSHSTQLPHMPQAVKQALNALDRVNACRGYAPASTSEPADQLHQQFLDGLDRYNARMGHTQSAATLSSDAHRQAGHLSHAADSINTNRGKSATAVSSPSLLRATNADPGGSAQQLDQRPHDSFSQVARRPADALDMFNMRHKGHSSTAELPVSATAHHRQQLRHPQQTCPADAQRALDGLDRFNARKGHHGATAATKDHSIASAGKEDTANDSQQSQTTSLEPDQISCLHSRAGALAGSSVTSHDPDALDRVNSVLLARRQSRDASLAGHYPSSSSPEATESRTHGQTDTKQQSRQQCGLRSAAAWQNDSSGLPPNPLLQSDNMPEGFTVRSKASHLRKRMRAFDDDIDRGLAQQGNVIRRVLPACQSAVNSDGFRSGRAVQKGGVFTRLGQ